MADQRSWWPDTLDGYVCPADRGTLRRVGERLACEGCERSFGLHGGVLDLDVVKASEREAFDVVFRGQEAMSERERTASLGIAERFLSALNRDLRDARVLDVACGNGALTYGLLASPRVRNTDVYCFDHSVESMRVFLATAPALATANRLHPSLQDVHRLAYADGFFDVVFGSAVLHHFLEYEAVLAQVRRVLKPGGVAVFAEPALYGYAWASFLLQLASRDVDRPRVSGPVASPASLLGSARSAAEKLLSTIRKPAAPASAPPLPRGKRGQLAWFVQDTWFRIEHHADKQQLSALTDKHYFVDAEIANLAADLGFTVRFAPYEPAGYYAGFVGDLLRTYGVEDPALLERAEELYGILREALPNSLHRVVPHFKFILLERR